MAYEMQWTERDMLLQMNEEIKQTNKAISIENDLLLTENKLLRQAVKDMFEYLVDDIELQSLIAQETWDRWEALVYNDPIQLRLFD